MLANNPILMSSDNRPVNYRLSADLVKRIKHEAFAEGLSSEAGRAYNPSAVVERILRAYFDSKPKRGEKSK